MSRGYPPVRDAAGAIWTRHADGLWYGRTGDTIVTHDEMLRRGPFVALNRSCTNRQVRAMNEGYPPDAVAAALAAAVARSEVRQANIESRRVAEQAELDNLAAQRRAYQRQQARLAKMRGDR